MALGYPQSPWRTLELRRRSLVARQLYDVGSVSVRSLRDHEGMILFGFHELPNPAGGAGQGPGRLEGIG